MDVSNIYGPIINGSEVALAIGNYNNVHGLLTYIAGDTLQMKSLSNVVSPVIIELVLNYSTDNKFSLGVKGTDTYIGVESPQLVGEMRTVTAAITNVKTYFTLDFSTVDKLPRNKILSGVLYSLRTVVGEQQYTVNWKIQGFADGDLVIFLPTTWYERAELKAGLLAEPRAELKAELRAETKAGLLAELRAETNTCNKWTDTPILLDKLNQLRFRGYTNQKWCEQLPTLTHCTADSNCGKCLGNCHRNDHICYPDTNGNFVCGIIDDTQDIVAPAITTVTSSISRASATWIALGAILIIVALLAYGLFRR